MYPQPPPSGQPQPGNAPTTAWLASGPPAQFPAPERPSASRHILTLVVVAAALLVVLAGAGTAVTLNVRSLDRQVSTLDSDIAARKAAQASQRAQLTREFQQSNLSGKLQQVRSMTEAAQQALLEWGRLGGPASGIKVVQLARNACEAAVIDYDATAARFPADLLSGLPLRIDMNDSSTNCDRSTS
ncbi:MAG TPA: hypothetical protein VJT31_13680 [Rugosimonospora sp.]|nr:hypothetical protein [Rugosimonospora sp.]